METECEDRSAGGNGHRGARDETTAEHDTPPKTSWLSSHTVRQQFRSVKVPSAPTPAPTRAHGSNDGLRRSANSRRRWMRHSSISTTTRTPTPRKNAATVQE